MPATSTSTAASPGAIVRRQPFGGWKRSAVGTSTKAGGPNYLMTLGSWEPLESDPGEDLSLEGISEPVARVIERAQAGLEFLEFDRVRLGAVRDEKAWLSEFGVSRDVSQLGVERNVLRYRPIPVTIRLSEGGSMGDLVRLIAAGDSSRIRARRQHVDSAAAAAGRPVRRARLTDAASSR